MPATPEHSVSSEPVLILLHGATLNGRMWDPMARHLNPRYRRLAPDLPGHGARRDERYTLDGAVATVVAAARSVGSAPIVLVGDSLGAYTAMASASALSQHQLKGLVLGGATFNFFGADVFPYVARGAIFRALAAVFGEQRLIRRLMPKTLGPGKLNLEPADAKALMDAGLSLTVFSQAVKALRRIDFRAILREIRQPVLIVNGGKDRVNIRQEASFLAVARNASSRRFENCEHGVSLWRYAEFARLVNAFADRVFSQQPTIEAAHDGPSR